MSSSFDFLEIWISLLRRAFDDKGSFQELRENCLTTWKECNRAVEGKTFSKYVPVEDGVSMDVIRWPNCSFCLLITERQTDRQSKRPRERHSHSETDRQKDRQTETVKQSEREAWISGRSPITAVSRGRNVSVRIGVVDWGRGVTHGKSIGGRK